MNGRGRVLLIALLVWIGPLPLFAEIDSLPLPPPPENYRIPNVPFIPPTLHDSATGALASVLSFWGKPLEGQDLPGAEAFIHPKGTAYANLERTVRSRGLDLWLYRGSLADLRNHLTMNHPVIAFLGEGTGDDPEEASVVVTGYDDRNRKITAHSPTGPNRSLTYDAFVEKWAGADFLTLLILPREPMKGP